MSFQPAPLPADEEQRLRVLRELAILDTAPEPAYDAIARLAAQAAGAAIGLLCFVDEHRQWFKAQSADAAAGLERCETPREHAFCAHAILADEPTVVEDASADERFADNPLVRGAPHIRFYAGVPVQVDGRRVATVAVIDRRPRRLDDAQRSALQQLAALAGALLAARLREQRARLQEARMRTASRTSIDWLWETDDRGRITWLSESAAQHLGDFASRALGRPWTETYARHAGDDAQWHRWKQALQRREPFHDIPLTRERDGRPLVIALSGVPVFDSSGRFMGYRGAARDVTEQMRLREESRRTAEALAVAEERWKFALEGAGQGVWDWDLAERRLYVSPGWRRVLGLPDDWQPHEPDDWLHSIHPDEQPNTRRRLIEHLRGDTPVYVDEYHMRHASGRWVWVMNRGKVVARGDDGRARRMVGTLLDVSERREAEAARRDREAAELASRAKSRFLSRMSQEMRTPLNAVLGFGQLLQDAPVAADPQRVREYADHVVRAGRNLLELVDDVLDLQRIEDEHFRLELKVVDVAPLIDRAASAVQPTAEARGVHLHVELPVGTRVVADEQRLLQVLVNLSSNAVKYNRPAGVVRWTLEPSGATTTLVIEDSGTGMSESQLGRLFEPFERLGRETSSIEGTGLGLIIARKLVERMGGRLRVSSRPGIGTRAMVDLPTAPAPAEPAPPPAAAPTDAASQREPVRLLYVEDNRVNALLFKEAVRVLGAVDLRVAEDGPEAIDIVRDWRPDVLVLDAHLPGMTGYEVLQQLRATPGLADTPAFMCSADAMPEDLARARAAGFSGYWTKPIDIKRVIADLQQLRIAR